MPGVTVWDRSPFIVYTYLRKYIFASTWHQRDSVSYCISLAPSWRYTVAYADTVAVRLRGAPVARENAPNVHLIGYTLCWTVRQICSLFSRFAETKNERCIAVQTRNVQKWTAKPWHAERRRGWPKHAITAGIIVCHCSRVSNFSSSPSSLVWLQLNRLTLSQSTRIVLCPAAKLHGAPIKSKPLPSRIKTRQRSRFSSNYKCRKSTNTYYCWLAY